MCSLKKFESFAIASMRMRSTGAVQLLRSPSAHKKEISVTQYELLYLHKHQTNAYARHAGLKAKAQSLQASR